MTEGWIETQVAVSVRGGRCPICDAVEAGGENYLTWIRANLNDEQFRQAAAASGGYCARHLQAVIDSLKSNPYSRLNLLKVMRSVLLTHGGDFPTSGCHLCLSLRQTAEAYTVVINSSQDGAKRDWLAALCGTHKSLRNQRPGPPEKRRAASRKPSARRPMPSSLMVMDFLKTTEVLLTNFHLKDPETLHREVERCEALLNKITRAGDG